MTSHIVSDTCKTIPLIFIFFATWFRQINIFWAKQILFSHLAKVASGSGNPAAVLPHTWLDTVYKNRSVYLVLKTYRLNVCISVSEQDMVRQFILDNHILFIETGNHL